MIYTYENGILEEYEVVVDKEALKKVMDDIIENCSIIKEGSCVLSDKEVSSYISKVEDEHDSKIKNLKRIENSDGKDEYTYSEYFFPKIVYILNVILAGDMTGLKDIFETDDVDYDRYKNYFVNQATSLLNEYQQTDDIAKLYELERFIHIYGYSTAPKDRIESYYGAIQSCITLKKVNTCNTEQLVDMKREYRDNSCEELTRRLNEAKLLQEKIDNSVDKQFIERMNRSNGKKK